MEAVDEPSVERQPYPRTAQACQRCRSLKTRCLPSEQPGTCRRCVSSRKECLWAETPRRPKRMRGPSRISQVEQKIDGLVATLVNAETGARPAPKPLPAKPQSSTSNESSQGMLSFMRPAAPGSWLPVPASFEPQPDDPESSQRFVEKLRDIHNFGNDEADLSRPRDSLFNTPSQNESPLDHDIVKHLLASGEADTLLDEYRRMSESFPFVPISDSVDAHTLSTTKPMLFLVIQLVASWKDHGRQMALDGTYRQELANRTIIRPRRTLSLVQSIVVYLSWYHFVFSHKTQQIYSLVQLTIGLALDLGIHKTTPWHFDIPGRLKPNQPSPTEQRERQRTFLGCYHVSSAVTTGFSKPNLLKYTDYMAECGKRLRDDREYPTDENIGRLISLRRIDDQIHDTFNAEEACELPVTDSRILMNLRFMKNQLEEWRREYTNSYHSRAIELAHSFTDMQLHAVGLRPAQPDYLQQSSNTTQMNCLLATLEAGKRFFDLLLAFPVSEYHYILFADWMRVPHVVITMSRLCIPSETLAAAQWDVKTAQDRMRLDLYLESLCYRMQGLSTFDKAKQPHPDFWWAMRMILELTRTWYCRKIGGKAPSSQATPQGIPTPDTTGQSATGSSAGNDAAGFSFTAMGSMDMNIASMEVSNAGHDPFAFMRDVDFDMDQFLDMGIWGSDGYEGMGFGGNKSS